MSILLIILLSYGYSPADSSWNLVSLDNIPQRAVLFAELAAKDGGRAAIDLAAMLEMAARFPEAEHCYRLAVNSAEDTLLSEWIDNRIRGCRNLDTLVILSTVITNTSDIDATDISIEIPLPRSHPPFQHVEMLGGVFRENHDIMSYHIDTLPSRSAVVLPLILHIVQQPFSFRPLPLHYRGISGSVALEDISSLIRTVQIPEEVTGPGPCLEIAYLVQDIAEDADLELQIIGGLIRSGPDSLLFHAWNCFPETEMPVDALLFNADSLRGIGHCPADIIPLWDFEPTEGHEVSIFYPQQEAQLAVSMKASYGDRKIIEAILELLPMCFSTEIQL